MQQSTTELSGEIVYRIDDQGRIVHVDGNWNAFAVANDAPELADTAVLGRPLDGFIADRETRHLLHVLMQRAGTTGRPLSVRFRCDAPHERRALDLAVIPLEHGFEFRSRPLQIDSRPMQRLLDRRAPRGPDLLTMCSWCNRLRLDEKWLDVEVVVDRLGLFETPLLPALTHGICLDCVALVADA